MRRVRSLAPWLLLLALSACGEEARKPTKDGSVAADAAQLDLGTAFVGETVQGRVRVQNRGRVSGAVRLEVSGPFQAGATGGDSLAPGEIAEVTVTFRPSSGDPASGTLAVSVDGVPGKVEVGLSGQGVRRTLEMNLLLSFGVIDVGSVGRAELPIHNPTPLPQTVTATLDGTNGKTFVLEATRLVIPPGETAPVTVTFTPGLAVAYAETMNVRACPTCESTAVLVSGSGKARQVRYAPRDLEFGVVALGDVVTLPVRLINGNEGDVFVASIRLVAGPGSPFTAELPELPAKLPPGELALPITFAPTEPIASTAHLRIEAEGTILDVPIAGEGGDGGLVARPPALAFGTVPASDHPRLTTSVSDTGTGAVRSVIGLRVEGQDPDRFLATAARQLPAGIRDVPLDVGVTFDTGQPGTFAAELVVEFDDASERRVPLSGTAVSGGYCDLQLEPAALRFGLQAFGQPVERSVILRNPTALACSVGPFALTGSVAFSASAFDPSQRRLLPARGSLEIKVRYAPTRGAGTERGALELEQTHPTVKLRSVALEGTGSEPVVRVEPAVVFFPQGGLGGEQLMAVNLHNVSPFPLRIVGQQIVPGSGDVAVLPTPGFLPEGETITAHVRVKPSDRTSLADLDVEVDGAAAPVVVPVVAPLATARCTGATCPVPVVSCPADGESWLQRDHVLTGAAAAGATSCAWNVVSAPGGSVAAPVPGKDCAAVFRPDVAGAYVLELTATAGARTATCRTKLQVKAFQGLWIESRPRTAGEVVELHLFLPTAGRLNDPTTWKAIPDHAWSQRPRPPWGAAGLDDDPIVEAGSAGIPSVGRVVAPSTGGTYALGLHWAATRTGRTLDVDTIIWCGGAQRATVSTTFSEPYRAVHVGNIRPGAGGTCTFEPSGSSIVVKP